MKYVFVGGPADRQCLEVSGDRQSCEIFDHRPISSGKITHVLYERTRIFCSDGPECVFYRAKGMTVAEALKGVFGSYAR